MELKERIVTFFSKEKIKKALLYIVGFIVSMAIVLGVKGCLKNTNMPEEFKDAKKILREVGFSSIKYTNTEKDLYELFEILEIDAVGVEEALVGYNDSAEEMFIILRCDSTLHANETEWEMVSLAVNSSDSYTVKKEYTFIYFGNKELVSKILK